jgi:2-polyprenyl-3-methyl-5-hydroxy-6-metoxy-1,4-benzoquinol methylase
MTKPPPTRLAYDPGMFNVRSLREAQHVIMTPQGGATSMQRWSKETPYESQRASELLGLTPTHLVLDHGCGVGRIAREVILRTGCTVIGADISPSMRQLAVGYVGSSRFSAVSLDVLRELIRRGLRFDAVMSIWVLMHLPRPAEEIALFHEALRPGGLLYAISAVRERALPTTRGYVSVNDGIDVPQLLRETFDELHYGAPSEAIIPAAIAKLFFIGLYRRR